MKHYGKLTAAAAAGFMTLSAIGVAPVFAAEPTVNISTELDLKDGDLNAPAASFTYVVTPTEPSTATQKFGNDTFDVYKGLDNGLGTNMTSNTVGEKSTTKVPYTGATLTAASNGYSKPGAYKYTLTQTVSSDNKANDGIAPDTTSYDVYVFVEANEAGVLAPSAIVAYKGTDKATAISFANELATKQISVEKQVTGNQADRNKEFEFTIKATGASGDKFKWSTDGKTWYDMNVTADANGNNTIDTQKLNHGDKVYIKGLTPNDTYEASEKEADYTLKSITTNGTEDATALAAKKATGTASEQKTIVFTNEKKGAVPTGILMSAAPYVGLVGLGGIFAGLFFRRKRED